MALQPLLGPRLCFSFVICSYIDGRTPWTSDQLVARPLPEHRKTRTQIKHTEISMPWVGFEPMIPAFVRVQTVHALDRVITMIGENCLHMHKFLPSLQLGAITLARSNANVGRTALGCLILYWVLFYYYCTHSCIWKSGVFIRNGNGM
jgi:hypothetical protein